MKIIYRLPQFLIIVVIIGMVFSIYPYVKLDSATNFFEMVKYQSMIDKSLVEVTGIDWYMILNNIVNVFIIILAILRRDLIKANIGIASLIAVFFILQLICGVGILIKLEDICEGTKFALMSLDGQYVFGTVPATIVLVLVLAKLLRKNVWLLLDFIAPLWLTKLVFVRLACFSFGCCGIDACTILGVELAIPVQLLEVAISLILLQVVFNIEKKNIALDDYSTNAGITFFIALGGHALYRFLLEFLRDKPDLFMGITFAHIYSAICMIVAVIYIVKIKKRVTNNSLY